MDKAKFYEQLLSTFIDELDGHVRNMNEDLLALEKGDANENIEERFLRLFRAVHSLKGAARAVDLPVIEKLSHHLEDVFTALREGKIPAEKGLFSLLFSSADAIEAAGMQLREKSPLVTQPMEDLIPRLKAVIAKPASSSDEKSSNAKPVPETENLPAKPPKTQTPKPDSVKPDLPVPPQPEVKTEFEEPGESETPSATAQQPKPNRTSVGGTVRVAEEKLDSLLAQVAELLVARQRVERSPAHLESLAELITVCQTAWQRLERAFRESGPNAQLTLRTTGPGPLAEFAKFRVQHFKPLEKAFEQFRRELVSDVRQLQHASSALQEDVYRIRMVPFQEACAGLDRVVRDLSTTTGKDVELKIEGGDIEVDRSVLEGLRDPLLHLVRNAIDHGIESGEERQQQGKPLTATVRVSASLSGSQVEILVSDDGRGLDLEKIKHKLLEKGLPVPQDRGHLIRQIFQPGFSTASIITDVSGRGVGMDVVKSQIESLRGTVNGSTITGQGTRFVLSVPLTLTTISALLFKSGGQTFAIPSSHVIKLIQFERPQLRPSQNGFVLPFVEAPLPVVSLAELLKQREADRPSDKPLLGVVLSTGDLQAVAVVDEVISEQEIVIKNLGPRVRRVRFVSGATLLPSGRIALLLNVPNLLQCLSEGEFANNLVTQAPSKTKKIHQVLLADDSLTTRTLFKSILEAAGYVVTTAVDGRDAWEKLQNLEPDLVVSDVDMPNMNGFQLTKAIRGSEKTKRLPVILVTARDTEADKVRGLQSGADAYLVKSTFHQSNLLDTMSQLL